MIRKKTVDFVRFRVNVAQHDIDEGECRLPQKCMQKVAVTRALKHKFDVDDAKLRDLHVRVDAGHIKFNFAGHRWSAPTPKPAKIALFDFDKKKQVAPHAYTVEAVQGNRIVKMTTERMQQIYDAREKRARAGKPDKNYEPNRIRQRVVGYDLGRTKRTRKDMQP